jgi:hypothetical protein
MPDLNINELVKDGKSILQLEKEVIAKLNAYYSCKVQPGDNDSTSYLESDDPTCKGTLSDVNIAINALNSALEKQLTSGNNTSANIYETQQTHDKILKLRNELDIKMKEINRSQDSVYSMYKAKYDSTMYSSIIWTILATSLIYYIFVKL